MGILGMWFVSPLLRKSDKLQHMFLKLCYNTATTKRLPKICVTRDYVNWIKNLSRLKMVIHLKPRSLPRDKQFLISHIS